MMVLYILFERGQNRTYLDKNGAARLGLSVLINDFKPLDKRYVMFGERLCVCVNKGGEKASDSIQNHKAQM